MAQLRVKLLARGKSLTPYVSSVKTGGWVQEEFGKKIGGPVGQCVRSKLAGRGKKNGGQVLSTKEVHDAVRECAPNKGTISLK